MTRRQGQCRSLGLMQRDGYWVCSCSTTKRVPCVHQEIPLPWRGTRGTRLRVAGGVVSSHAHMLTCSHAHMPADTRQFLQLQPSGQPTLAYRLRQLVS
jgi:hypothetical protein